MRTAELTGALLDYWVARAEGLSVGIVNGRPVLWVGARCDKPGCAVVHKRGGPAPAYSSNWMHSGPLIDKHIANLTTDGFSWRAVAWEAAGVKCPAEGATPLQAICRAVVRAAFGDEVPDEIGGA